LTGIEAPVLGEFFAADPADVNSDLLDEGPAGRYPSVEAKTLRIRCRSRHWAKSSVSGLEMS
jgi:hypothetical protein